MPAKLRCFSDGAEFAEDIGHSSQPEEVRLTPLNKVTWYVRVTSVANSGPSIS